VSCRRRKTDSSDEGTETDSGEGKQFRLFLWTDGIRKKSFPPFLPGRILKPLGFTSKNLMLSRIRNKTPFGIENPETN